MTDYQNELVMEHLDLVNWVIRTRISVPNRPLPWPLRITTAFISMPATTSPGAYRPDCCAP